MWARKLLEIAVGDRHIRLMAVSIFEERFGFPRCDFTFLCPEQKKDTDQKSGLRSKKKLVKSEKPATHVSPYV